MVPVKIEPSGQPAHAAVAGQSTVPPQILEADLPHSVGQVSAQQFFVPAGVHLAAVHVLMGSAPRQV